MSLAGGVSRRIEEYLKTSSESIGQEIVWDKEKTVADFD